MKITPPIPTVPRPILFVGLILAILLAGFGSCKLVHRRPRITMSFLDSRARPHIEAAQAAIPVAVSRICEHRMHLFKLLLSDKLTGGKKAQTFIAGVIGPTIVEPLGKAAAVYACATNANAAVDLATEAAMDSLTSQLYAASSLAMEAILLKSIIQSARNTIASCVPRLAASWGAAGTCAVADGPLPIGDIIGLVLAAGGTALSLHDIHRACAMLPSNLTASLEEAVAATVAQCRLEAASAL